MSDTSNSNQTTPQTTQSVPYSFKFEDSDTGSLDQQAKEYQKEYLDSGGGFGGARIWCVYVPDGNFTFRFYPDRDDRGHARLIKRIWVHKGLPINAKKKVWCTGDARVDALMSEIEQEGMKSVFGKQPWQWKSTETGLACAHVYESTDKEYVQAGYSMILLLQKRQIFAFQEFVAELHPEDKRKLFDPNLSAVGINFKVTKAASKSNVSVGISGMRLLHLPMPPTLTTSEESDRQIPFESLDKVYITADQVLSDQDWEEFRRNVYIELEKFKASGGGAKDTTGQGASFQSQPTPTQGPAYAPQPQSLSSAATPQMAPQAPPVASPPPPPVQVAPAPQVTVAPPVASPAPQPAPSQPAAPVTPPVGTPLVSDEDKCGLAQKIKMHPDTAEAYGTEVRFGNHPARKNPYCIVCDYEQECILLTLKAKNAKS